MLRPYQNDMVQQVRQSYKNGYKRPCLVLPCGGGKSIIVAEMAKLATKKNGFVWFIVHRKELCDQIRKTFTSWGVDMSKCLITMVQSAKKHLGKTEKPVLIIFDESHHVLANTYKEIIDYYYDVKCIGVTATPTRLSGGGLGEINDDLIIGVSAQWLITNKYLSPYKYYSMPVAELDDLKIKRGDYDVVQLAEIMENNKIYGDTVENYRKLADGKKTIIYCSSVKSSKDTAEEFQKQGYKAISLDGASKKQERLEAMERFRAGEIKILCNADLFGEGLDVPDVECVILLRKTKSLTLFIQQSMRCMRYQENKTAIIIDHVGNVFEHGFPDDDREWTLDPKKKNQQTEVKVKTCPSCFAVIELNTLICPYCKFDFTEEVKERKEKERVELELIELERQQQEKLKNIKYNEIDQFKTFDELASYQKIKGYKFMWCIRQAIILNIPVPSKYDNMRRYMR